MNDLDLFPSSSPIFHHRHLPLALTTPHTLVPGGFPPASPSSKARRRLPTLAVYSRSGGSWPRFPSTLRSTLLAHLRSASSHASLMSRQEKLEQAAGQQAGRTARRKQQQERR